MNIPQFQIDFSFSVNLLKLIQNEPPPQPPGGGGWGGQLGENKDIPGKFIEVKLFYVPSRCHRLHQFIGRSILWV